MALDKNPPNITAEILEQLATDSVKLSNQKTKGLLEIFIPSRREHRVEKEADQYRRLITDLNSRYPQVSKYITDHKNDIDPASPDINNPFYAKCTKIFKARNQSIDNI